MVEGWKEQVIILCLSALLNSPPVLRCIHPGNHLTHARTYAAIRLPPSLFPSSHNVIFFHSLDIPPARRGGFCSGTTD